MRDANGSRFHLQITSCSSFMLEQGDLADPNWVTTWAEGSGHFWDRKDAKAQAARPCGGRTDPARLSA